MRNAVNSAVRSEKRSFFNHSEIGKLWKDLRGLSKKRPANLELPPSMLDCSKINNYFIDSVPTSAPNKDLIDFYKNNLKDGVQPISCFKTITEAEVFRIIQNIKTKAIGVDRIGIATIKLCVPFLLPFITHIINFCLANSVFPDIWKKARVLPLPKIQQPLECKDFRPISILPMFIKILERSIEVQVREFIEKK